MLLGTPKVVFEDGHEESLGADQAAQVLALLLVHRGEPVSRHSVIEGIWELPEGSEKDPNALLRPVLSNLRTLLKRLDIEGLGLPEEGPLQLDLPEGVTVDVHAVESAFEAFERSTDDDVRWVEVRRVADRLSAEFLEDCNLTPFLVEQRERLADYRYHAQLEAVRIALRSGLPERRKAAKQDAMAAIERWPEEEAPRLSLVQLHLEDDSITQATITLDALDREVGSSGDADGLRGQLARRQWYQENKPMPLVLTLTEDEEEAPFIGHTREILMLENHLGRAMAGEYRCVILGGDKGIGKSRLARELGRRAHRRGCAVISTSALQPTSRQDHPCRPLIDAVGVWVQKFGVDSLERIQPTDLYEISRQAPELFEPVVDTAEEPANPSPEALSAALLRVLAEITRLAPTVILIDDIQAADDQTLAVLSMPQPTPHNLMIIATGPSELRSALPMRRVAVPPLTDSEAQQLTAAIQSENGEDDTPSLIRGLGGNPFLIVNQTSLHRIEADFILPQLRLAGDDPHRLGHRVLRLAALLGSPFEIGVLNAAIDENIEASLSLAEACKLIRPGKDPSTFEFSHSLIREALLDGIPHIEHSRLARLLVDAMEPLPKTATARLRLLKEVAATRDVTSEAAAAALEAAEHATSLLNYAAARTRCEEGLEIVVAEDVALRGRLLVVLGHSLWSLGEFARARRRFAEAVRLDELPPVVRAEAALGFGGRLGVAGASTDRDYKRMLRGVMGEVPAKHRDLRLRLRAALASAMTFGLLTPAEEEERKELCARALREAAEHQDPALRAEVLSDLCWVTWQPDQLQQRRDLADEFVAAAESSRDLNLRIEARIFRLAYSLEIGDMAAVERDLSRSEELTERSDQPHFKALLALLDGMRLLMNGPPGVAEEQAGKALATGGREQNPAVFELYGAQILLIRLLQGRVDKIRSAAEAMAEAFPGLLGLRAGLGVIYAELGRDEDARRQLDMIGHGHFQEIPQDVFWLVTIEHAARLAARLGDIPRCEEIYELLAPYAGKIVVAGGAVAVYGAADRALGLLAAAQGDDELAADHLRAAVELNDDIGARTINAYVTRELAEVLARIGGPDEEIEQLREVSARTAAEYGLVLNAADEARDYAKPSAPPGRLGGLKQKGAQNFSHWLRSRIQDRTDEDIEQWHFGVRILRRIMPTAFVPGAACGWSGKIQIEFDPPIGFRSRNPFWTFEIGLEKARITPRRSGEAAKLSLKMSPATFFRLVAGEVNPVEAWLDGRTTIEGDPTVAARLIEMFSGPAVMTLDDEAS